MQKGASRACSLKLLRILHLRLVFAGPHPSGVMPAVSQLRQVGACIWPFLDL